MAIRLSQGVRRGAANPALIRVMTLTVAVGATAWLGLRAESLRLARSHARYSWWRDDSPRGRALRGAFWEMRRAMRPRRRGDVTEIMPRQDLEEAKARFLEISRTYGPCAAAWAGRARCQLELGEFSAALRSYQYATSLEPDNEFLARRYAWAKEVAAVAHSVLGREVERVSFTPGRQEERKQISSFWWTSQVLQVQPFEFRDGVVQNWLVLTAEVRRRENPSDADYTGLRLRLLDASPGYRRLWEAPVGPDGPDDGIHVLFECYNDVRLHVLRVGDFHEPIALVDKVVSGGNWNPSSVDVYRWFYDGGLSRVFTLLSSQPIWVEDLDGDGTPEIGNIVPIGRVAVPADELYWSDIYSWNGQTFTNANDRFPAEFAAYPEQLREVLSKYPQDQELRHYLALSERILAGRR